MGFQNDFILLVEESNSGIFSVLVRFNQSSYSTEFFTINFFLFSCPSPWSGVECENRSSSEEFTCKDFCKNGGLCLNGKSGPFCHCKSNWKGKHCTVQSSCRSYCLNGGTCQEPVDEFSSPTCM